MRIPLKFHIYSICNARFKCFQVSRPPFWFPAELGSNCAQGDFDISSGDFGILKKQTERRWICFQRRFTPFYSMVTRFITFPPKNHPPHLHFWWCNSITGKTISKISTSFHALMTIGIRQSAMENVDGQLRYSRKTRVLQLLHSPRCSRVKTTFFTQPASCLIQGISPLSYG